MWNEFKTTINDPGLDRFDLPLEALHKFEDVRYPESIVQRGMQVVFVLRPLEPDVVQKYDKRPLPHYLLAIEELDILVHAIIQSAGVDPEQVLAQFGPYVRNHLRRIEFRA